MIISVVSNPIKVVVVVVVIVVVVNVVVVALLVIGHIIFSYGQ